MYSRTMVTTRRYQICTENGNMSEHLNSMFDWIGLSSVLRPLIRYSLEHFLTCLPKQHQYGMPM